MERKLHIAPHRGWLATAMVMLAAAAYSQGGTTVFSETFDTQEDFDKWKIEDLNGGRSWEFLNGTAAYMLDYQTGLPGDDWLISPAFELEADKVYELRFSKKVPSKTQTESFKVALGTTDSHDSFTTILGDYDHITAADDGIEVLKVLVGETGEYRLGYYAYSDANQMRLEIDDIYLTEVSTKAVPNPVSDLTAVAGEKGALTATLSFVAPSLNAGESELSELSAIDIYRGDNSTTPVKTFENTEIGASLTWTDEQAAQGYTTYTVVARNSAGESASAEATVFVGVDVTVAVGSVKAKYKKDTTVTLSWTAPTETVNGGYVDFSALKYKISRNGGAIEESVEGTEYVDNEPVSRGQDIVSYSVVAISAGGESKAATSGGILVGTPLSVPYSESFANGEFTTSAWVQDGDTDSFDWEMMQDSEDEYEVVSQDGDNGMLMCRTSYGDNGEISRFISPILELDGVANPVLSFYLFHAQSPWYDPDYDGVIDDHVKVQVSVDGGDWQDLENAVFYNTKDNNGWVECKVSLRRYEGSFVNIGLVGVPENDFSSYKDLFVDNIRIDEAEHQNDLSLDGFTVDKKRISVGEKAEFSVAVFNKGAAATADYTVTLSKDGEPYATEQGVSVNPAQKSTFTFEVVGTLDDTEAESSIWTAEVTSATDEYEANNVSDEISFSVRKPEVPAVDDLAATNTTAGVELSWTALQSVEATPQGDPVTVTDDFESYEPFAISDFGDWTVVDVDGAETLSSPRIPSDYPHHGEPMAFQVFNIVDAGVWVDENTDDAFKPKNGGVQYLICPSADYPAENDDWLISPRLDGRRQTISFYAKSATYDLEWIEVYYSTTDTHPDSFVKISEGDHVSVMEIWKEYKYELPERAKYFAVRCVRRSVFLFIDDITYNKHDGSPDAATLKGYNVYRNGERINDGLVAENRYSDNSIAEGQKYSYRVTAVYEEGESAYSNEATVNYGGVYDLSVAGVKITTEGSVLTVEMPSPTNVAVYSMDGRTVCNEANTSKLVRSLPQGIYIVKAGATVKKIAL